MKLLEKDVEVLDYIVNICLNEDFIQECDLKTPTHIQKASNYSLDERLIARLRVKYYKYYFTILSEYDFIKIDVSETSTNMSAKVLTAKTKRFVEDGGFKQLYKEQVKKEAYNKRINEGNLANASNSIWTKRTYWWTFGIAIAGFVLSLVASYFAIKSYYNNP